MITNLQKFLDARANLTKSNPPLKIEDIRAWWEVKVNDLFDEIFNWIRGDDVCVRIDRKTGYLIITIHDEVVNIYSEYSMFLDELVYMIMIDGPLSRQAKLILKYIGTDEEIIIYRKFPTRPVAWYLMEGNSPPIDSDQFCRILMKLLPEI